MDPVLENSRQIASSLAPRNDDLASSLRAHGSALCARPEDRLREAISITKHDLKC